MLTLHPTQRLRCHLTFPMAKMFWTSFRFFFCLFFLCSWSENISKTWQWWMYLCMNKTTQNRLLDCTLHIVQTQLPFTRIFYRLVNFYASLLSWILASFASISVTTIKTDKQTNKKANIHHCIFTIIKHQALVVISCYGLSYWQNATALSSLWVWLTPNMFVSLWDVSHSHCHVSDWQLCSLTPFRGLLVIICRNCTSDWYMWRTCCPINITIFFPYPLWLPVKLCTWTRPKRMY